MIRSLYTSAQSLLSNNKAMDVSTNNISNANTVAYKRDTVVYESFSNVLAKRINDSSSASNPTGQIGKLDYGNDIGEIYTFYNQGQITATGNKLDFSINNSENSFFTVGIPDENNELRESYTRDGRFSLNKDGYLVTLEGYFVMGNDGPLRPTSENFSIDSSGKLSIDNQTKQDSFKIATFADTRTLSKINSNMVEKSDNSELVEFKGEVRQGSIENSNVNAVREMVNIVNVMRSYETSQKIIQMLDTTLEKSVNELVNQDKGMI